MCYVPLVFTSMGAWLVGYLLLDERTWCLIQPVGADDGREVKKAKKKILIFLFDFIIRFVVSNTARTLTARFARLSGVTGAAAK